MLCSISTCKMKMSCIFFLEFYSEYILLSEIGLTFTLGWRHIFEKGSSGKVDKFLHSSDSVYNLLQSKTCICV